METSTLFMMILILGIVWGGFAALLAHSMKAEKRRRAHGPATSSAAADGKGESG